MIAYTTAGKAQPIAVEELYTTYPQEEVDTEFKKKYPPDLQLGQELNDNARVWKVYRDEAIQHDDGLLQAWNNTINILLTFVRSSVSVFTVP